MGRRPDLILGVGNILLSDEGFGIHVVRRLTARGLGEKGVDLVDGGTGGLGLAEELDGRERVLVVDAAALPHPPGTLLMGGLDEFEPLLGRLRLSPHQAAFLDAIRTLRFHGRAPGRVELLCAVPQRLSPGLELSPCMEEAAEKAVAAGLRWAAGA